MQDLAEVNHMRCLNGISASPICKDLVHGLVPVCHSGNETAETVGALLHVVGDMGLNHLADLGLDPPKTATNARGK